jgi:thiamine pyrophosphokinase
MRTASRRSPMRLSLVVPRPRPSAFHPWTPAAVVAKSRHVIVVGAGERPPEHVKAEAAEREILAMDAGARWVLRWGLVPGRVLGDLDSLDERSRAYADQYGAPIVTLPRALGRSDLSCVVDLLLAERPSSVVFTGCVGPRLDHTAALFNGMARLALAGIQARSVERWGTAHVAAPGLRVTLKDVAGERASFFPLAAQVVGAQLSGFDEVIVPDPLVPPFDGLVGVPIVSDPAEVQVTSGALLVIVPRRGDAEDGAKGSVPTFRLGTLERTE